LKVSRNDNKGYGMGKSRQRWREKQLSVGFLALSDRDRITNQKSAGSWSELGLYLMEGLEDETTELQGEGWENSVVAEVGRQRELEDS
jgi:hypothetical protein